MQNIFPILESLSKKDFINYINQIKLKQKSPLLLKTILYIEKNYPSPIVNRENLYRHIYKNNTIDKNKINQLIYRVNQTLENYILQNNTKVKNQSYDLFIKYHQLDQKEHKKKTLKNLIANKGNNPFSNAKLDFIRKFETMYDLQYTDRTKDRFLQEANISIDQFYILEKLKLVAATLMHGKIFKISYELGIYSQLKPIIQTQWNLLDKNVQLLYNAILMIENEDELSYIHIKEEHIVLTKTKIEENKQIISMCINFCIQKINSGERSWIQEVFFWYQIQIDHDYLLEENELLTEGTYKNIISTSLLLNETKWAINFAKEFYQKLPKENQIDHYHFNIARIYFHNKDYQKVLELISKSDPKDTLINISIKVLLIKTWYVLDEYDILDSNLESFKIYLYRHKNMGYHYTMHTNFIKILRQILKENTFTITSKNKLVHKIQQLSYITEKSWLLSLLQ